MNNPSSGMTAPPEHDIAELISRVRAIDRAQAVIEFNLDGSIITANDNFLHAMGYRRDDIVGQHHRMFCEPSYVASQAYGEFWSKLRDGEFAIGEFKRLAKGGREVWIQATYNPILDADGKPTKVIKFAYDVTELKRKAADAEGKVRAIDRAQ